MPGGTVVSFLPVIQSTGISSSLPCELKYPRCGSPTTGAIALNLIAVCSDCPKNHANPPPFPTPVANMLLVSIQYSMLSSLINYSTKSRSSARQ